MTANFPDIEKGTPMQVEKSQMLPARFSATKSTARNIIKLSKVKDDCQNCKGKVADNTEESQLL